jgi:hypothetical protein
MQTSIRANSNFNLIFLAIVNVIVGFMFVLGFMDSAQAQQGNSTNPRVGRKVANDYFVKDREIVQKRTSSSGENLLMIGVGKYISSQAYQWDCSCKEEDIGGSIVGLTYLFDEWHNLDLNIRVDYAEFKPKNSSARKLSFIPLLTLPRAESDFPLYFGFGAGPGIFMSQAEGESGISLDYQLVVGTRFPHLFDFGGFYVEFAMKNHLHVLSDGQFNGTSLNFGAAFVF